jgi:uncharacterized protein (DUF58 family)
MLRPARPRKAAALVVALGAAFAAIARTSGAGWVVVLVAVLGGTLVAGALAPVGPLVRLRVRLEVPPDAVVGEPLPVRIVAPSGASVVLVRVEALGLPWVRARRGVVTAAPVRRQVLDAVELEAWCAAPLGLVAWRRRVRVPLAEPVYVAPAPLPMAVPARPAAPAGGDEVVRGVRRYQPGDPQRLVHWPSLARTGSLDVRELEAPGRPRLAVVVDLDGPAGSGAVERVASQAAGLVAAGLRQGLEVVLVTVEDGVVRSGPVRTTVEAGRRLACAGAGPVDSNEPGAVRLRAVEP